MKNEQVIREGVEAAFEERAGWRTKIAAAVRALATTVAPERSRKLVDDEPQLRDCNWCDNCYSGNGKPCTAPVQNPAQEADSSSAAPSEHQWIYVGGGTNQCGVCLMRAKNIPKEADEVAFDSACKGVAPAPTGESLNREDITSRLQGAMNAAPGSDSAEVSKLTLTQAIAALASTIAPKDPAAQGGVPEGFVLAPIEPTSEMLNCMDKSSAYQTWLNMLAAAPTGASK